jgi:hypothetical protein
MFCSHNFKLDSAWAATLIKTCKLHIAPFIAQLLKTLLNQLKSPVELKQTIFHGHRINLFFSMGASVFFDIFFYHRNHIKEFIEVYFNKEDRNRLVSSVYNYVNNQETPRFLH